MKGADPSAENRADDIIADLLDDPSVLTDRERTIEMLDGLSYGGLWKWMSHATPEQIRIARAHLESEEQIEASRAARARILDQLWQISDTKQRIRAAAHIEGKSPEELMEVVRQSDPEVLAKTLRLLASGGDTGKEYAALLEATRAVALEDAQVKQEGKR